MNLTIFNQLDFLPALREFFKALQVPIATVTDKPIAARDILTSTYRDRESFHLIDDVYWLGMVDDGAFRGRDGLDLVATQQLTKDYDGIVIFGVTLRRREGGLLPTRSHLAEISRAFNREFCYTPVVVVFRYGNGDGEYLAFANTERSPYKRDQEGEKVGKVTMLRDIDIRQPHSGHEKILADLRVPNTGKERVDSFAKLYAYWRKVLDVSLLNRQFYQEVSAWYFSACKQVVFPKDAKADNQESLIRLITRLMFVWFLKEKGLVPDDLFDQAELKQILKSLEPQESSYYKAILQNLFFATLNTEWGERQFIKRSGSQSHQYMVHNVFRYENYFQAPDQVISRYFANIPFLNGGLFECLDRRDKKDDPEVRIDGFSDNSKNPLSVLNALFFGDFQDVDLNADFGTSRKKYRVRGLIEIFKSYKFTVAENTPLEEDVALDPELLGQVFENLLAAYNPETQTTARKQTGSFYTPREIVNYMVDESLIAYLKNQIDPPQPPLERGEKSLGLEVPLFKGDLGGSLWQLVTHQSEVNPFADDEATTLALIEAIDRCQILDPACGSGAFPMGVLQKMVFVLRKLDPHNERWRNQQREKAIAPLLADIQTAQKISYEEAREKAIKELRDELAKIEASFANEMDYPRKLFLIQNCIFGVDIQPIAVQISKLRFFISLIIEQKEDRDADNRGILPLPNLETKFVAANTLIGLEKTQQLSVFDTQEIQAKQARLERLRRDHFFARSLATKRKKRDEDEQLCNEIAEILARNGFPNVALLQNWKPYDQNASASFFDPEWMFGVKDFDICIGNPPYGGSLTKKEVEYFKKTYTIKTSETAILFIEKGKRFLKSNGLLTYIIPKSYSFASNYTTTRDFTISELLLTVDCGKAFENVLLEAMVFLLKNNHSQKHYHCVSFDGREFLPVSTVEKSLVKEFGFILNGINQQEISIALKMRQSRKFLNDIATNIRGEAFQKFIDEDEGHYYVIGGAEINEYGIKGFKGLIDESNIVSEKGYIRDNSLLAQNIVAHIKNPFEHIKITVCIPTNTDDYLITDTINQITITDKSYSQEFIWAILKSNIVNWFTYYFIFGKAIRTMHFDSPITSRIPIPTAGESDRKAIEKLVSYVLYLTAQLKDIPSHGKEFMASADDQLMLSYFEQIIDAAVMELYLPEELHAGDKYFMRHLLQENLPNIDNLKGDKMAELRVIFRRLFDRDHPIRNNIYFLGNLDIVKIIRGQA